MYSMILNGILREGSFRGTDLGGCLEIIGSFVHGNQFGSIYKYHNL